MVLSRHFGICGWWAHSTGVPITVDSQPVHNRQSEEVSNRKSLVLYTLCSFHIYIVFYKFLWLWWTVICQRKIQPIISHCPARQEIIICSLYVCVRACFCFSHYLIWKITAYSMVDFMYLGLKKMSTLW